MKNHTDRQYEGELQQIRDRIVTMGGTVEGMIRDAMKALADSDAALATRVIERDRQVDAMEVEVDELCLRVIARRQPAASDLRFIAATLKLVVDVERIGDLAVNVCKRVRILATLPPQAPLVDLPRMAQLAQRMVSDALDAFVRRDATLARSLFSRDNSVDALHAQAVRELERSLRTSPDDVPRVMRLLSVAGYLERIGDHALKLAHQVVFLVEGHDVRHQGLGKPKVPDPKGLPAPQRGVLFVCGANAARSQMAEGWAQRLAPEGVEVASAGLRPAPVHPLAVETMAEVGVDISGARSKGLADVPLERFDTVVTLSDDAEGLALPATVRRLHWPMADPLPAPTGPHAVDAFRQIRDDLARLVERLFRKG